MMHVQGKWVKHGSRWYEFHYDYSDADLKYLRYVAGDKNAQDLTNLAICQEKVDKFFWLDAPQYMYKTVKNIVLGQ
jgi:hypothetical protein